MNSSADPAGASSRTDDEATPSPDADDAPGRDSDDLDEADDGASLADVDGVDPEEPDSSSSGEIDGVADTPTDPSALDDDEDADATPDDSVEPTSVDRGDQADDAPQITETEPDPGTDQTEDPVRPEPEPEGPAPEPEVEEPEPEVEEPEPEVEEPEVEEPELEPGPDPSTVRSRPEPATCDTQLPRDRTLESTSDYFSCTTDAECTVQAHGYCQEWVNGQIAESGADCRYGCVSDDDCAAGLVCDCGSLIGQCVSADCTTDADCVGGELCARYEYDDGCGPIVGYACTTPNDMCLTDADCGGADAMCGPGVDGRECHTLICAIGRPFLVDDEARLASVVLRDDWCEPTGLDASRLGVSERARLAGEWRRIGLMEHASVAAFARFTLQIMSLGAPPELLVASQQAMVDETEHARLAFGLASAYGGQRVGPGPLDIEHSLDAGDLVSILRMTVLEGCIGETVAALEAVEALAAVRDPALRSTLSKIARDEQHHAELAWRFVRWVLLQRPELSDSVRAIVQQELATARDAASVAVSDPASDWLLRHGLVSDSRRTELRLQVLVDVVTPSLDALCATVAAPSVAA